MFWLGYIFLILCSALLVDHVLEIIRVKPWCLPDQCSILFELDNWKRSHAGLPHLCSFIAVDMYFVVCGSLLVHHPFGCSASLAAFSAVNNDIHIVSPIYLFCGIEKAPRGKVSVVLILGRCRKWACNHLSKITTLLYHTYFSFVSVVSAGQSSFPFDRLFDHCHQVQAQGARQCNRWENRQWCVSLTSFHVL